LTGTWRPKRLICYRKYTGLAYRGQDWMMRG
jgi:hypothetical protein